YEGSAEYIDESSCAYRVNRPGICGPDAVCGLSICLEGYLQCCDEVQTGRDCRCRGRINLRGLIYMDRCKSQNLASRIDRLSGNFCFRRDRIIRVVFFLEFVFCGVRAEHSSL